ncbi:hypothetical protein BIZ37_23500 [Photobacterium sp. BZF1]|uniref:hypothetical protein n=1 Tax=Photobacterium sp. BZF1 TaxID=1904457 RepID=UPI001653AFA2|nr:hypothetical protein [Photobacterium sp. BZF1]MBC7005527.1 hypothetical protein [Photobacterium sp. BZF1]
MIRLKNGKDIQIVKHISGFNEYMYDGKIIYSSKNGNAEAVITAASHDCPEFSRDALIAQNALLRLRGDELSNLLLEIMKPEQKQEVVELVTKWYQDSMRDPHYTLSDLHAQIAIFANS